LVQEIQGKVERVYVAVKELVSLWFGHLLLNGMNEVEIKMAKIFTIKKWDILHHCE
jgi:hypothetical protein